MIGIDLVDVKRFERTTRLHRFIARFRVNGKTPLAVAKTWACVEAILKAEDQAFDPTKISIGFPDNHRPVVHDPDGVLSGVYALSISHENHMVIAVAIKV